MMPCNKIRFVSRADANAFAKDFRKGHARHTERKVRGTWRAYRCNKCTGEIWHLTTVSKAEEIQWRKRRKRNTST